MCVLCNDTFSRSDILKRHFQKCSVRRGNPEGVSHLSHPHAHRQKQPAGAKGIADEVHDSQNGANGSYTDGTGNNNTPVTNSFSEAPTVPYPQAPSNGLHRANSDDVYQTESSAANGGWFAKQNPVLYQSAPVSPEHFNMDLSAVEQSKSSSTSGSKQSLTAHHPGEADWNSPFHPVGGESYMNPMFPSSLSSGYDSVPAQSGVKKEVDHHDGAMNGLYVGSTSFGADGTLGPTPWNFDMLQEDPLQNKSDRLVDFCFPGGIQEQLQDPHDSAHLRVCLTADNLRHFLELFTNFQGHFPFIHMPTLNFSETYDGLILAIACIGAVYSDRVTQVQVRSLMERAKLGIKRTSGVYHVLQPDQSGLNFHMQKPPFTSSSDFEAIQALLALQLLATWHGNTIQRTSARADSLHLFRIARGLGMLSLARPQDATCYSYLHNIQPHEEIVVQKWEWRPWIEQEKRSRVMFLVFLLDAALVIYFNCTPQIDPSELKIPLPCDDAAWEANDAQACANALGLNGAAIRNAVNVTGSQRPKQFELHHALSALHAPTWLFHPRSTNVYSKFILIHALHIQIWHVQRQLSSNVSTLSLENYNVSAGRPYTPLSQHEWIAMDGEVSSAYSSHNNSGRVTPTESVSTQSGTQSPGVCAQSHALLKSVTAALVKWKRAWDQDMQIQYPPGANLYRRFGFCRDGAHFYWLARTFLRSNRPRDWQLPADGRFLQVINLLKTVRSWTQSDGAQRGEEPGSVGDIDESYGVDHLELDMAKLFKPINEQYDNAVGGMQACLRL